MGSGLRINQSPQNHRAGIKCQLKVEDATVNDTCLVMHEKKKHQSQILAVVNVVYLSAACIIWVVHILIQVHKRIHREPLKEKCYL